MTVWHWLLRNFKCTFAPRAAAQLRSGSMLVAMATAEPLPASRQATHLDLHGGNVST